jgi:hypothetical protein
MHQHLMKIQLITPEVEIIEEMETEEVTSFAEIMPLLTTF